MAKCGLFWRISGAGRGFPDTFPYLVRAGYYWLVAARGISTREIFNLYFNFLLTCQRSKDLQAGKIPMRIVIEGDSIDFDPGMGLYLPILLASSET